MATTPKARKPRQTSREVSTVTPAETHAPEQEAGPVIDGEVMEPGALARAYVNQQAQDAEHGGELATIKAGAQNAAAVYLAALAPGSRRTMRGALDTMAALLTGARWEAGALVGGTHDALTLPWYSLTSAHTMALRAKLAEHFAPATVNKQLAALRGVLGTCWQLQQMPTEEYHRAIKLKGIKATTLPRGRALSTGDLHGLFHACAQDKSTTLAARDAALLAILYGAGLRRSEAIGLDLADFDRETGALTVRHGKGDKARICYASNGSLLALEAWLAKRGEEAGPLFLPVRKGGHIEPRRLTDEAVRFILQKRAKQAGIKATSPHDLRRTFVSNLLDAGADIATVQRMAGHANVTTTARYDRRGEVAKQKASELLYVPFGG